MKNIETKVISAFPACGKSYVFQNEQDNFDGILDSDSSEFSWVKDKNGNNTTERNLNFPNNYIQHIKDNLGKVQIIFVSSHDVVRNALKENNINYTIVYPDISLKEDWIKRFEKRGNNEKFITFISNNWNKFITDIELETYPNKYKLEHRWNYLDADVVFYILGYGEH